MVLGGRKAAEAARKQTSPRTTGEDQASSSDGTLILKILMSIHSFVFSNLPKWGPEGKEGGWKKKRREEGRRRVGERGRERTSLIYISRGYKTIISPFVYVGHQSL